MPLSRPSGGWEQDRTEGEPGESNARALLSAISSPYETRDGRNRRQDRNGFIGSLRTFAPFDLGLVKSKENGCSRVMHACAKVPAVQPRATVKPVLQTAAISAAPYRFEDASRPRLSIFSAFAQAFPLTFRV